MNKTIMSQISFSAIQCGNFVTLLLQNRSRILYAIIYRMNNKFHRIAFNTVPCNIFLTYNARRIRIQIWSTSSTGTSIEHTRLFV